MLPTRAVLLATLATSLLGTAVAQPATPSARPGFTGLPAGKYAVEPTHARILFSLDHLGTSTWYGDFTHVSGSALIDPARPRSSSVEISVPISSVSTTNATLDGELKSADWFDAEKFPTATFKSTRVTVTGPGHGEIMGDLTLHGVTRPETLQVKFHGAGPNPMTHQFTAGFDATATIHRSDFGITKYVPMVGDEVSLIISAPFVKVSQP